MDGIDRAQMRTRIAVVRPHTPLDEPHPELRRRGILYLLRLAALTRRGVNDVVEWTATGSQMSLPGQAQGEYDGKFVAKYGCTTQRASIRFNHILERARELRFPNRHDLDPVFEVAITGILDFLLLQMEHGLRNYLGREGVRLQWHARETEPLSGNSNAFTEQFELVCTDATSDTLFDFYQNFAAHLDTARRGAIRDVEEEDRLRRRHIQSRRATLRQNHRREIARTRAQLLRGEAQQGKIQRMKVRHRAAIERIAAETPPFNVRGILEQRFIATAQMR